MQRRPSVSLEVHHRQSRPASSSALVPALSACLAKNCETQCGLSCGGFAGYFSMPDAAAACATCLEKNACSDERSCGTSAECDAFWRCYLACTTPDCHAVCALTHDAGAEQFQPLYSAFASTCSGPCGYGAYWACAGHVAWPNAMSTEVTYTGWIYDYQTKQGVSGAQVSICTNCPCNSPGNELVAQGQTDSTGHSTISFTQGIFNSGLGSSYCWQVSAPGYLTTFAYDGFPTVETRLALNPLNPGTVYGTPIETPANQMANESTLAPYDSTRSIWVAGNVLDCLTNPVPVGGADVSINVRDPMMVPYNMVDAGADAWPTVATGGANLPSNIALFFNVPVDAGSVTLTATVPGVGAVSGETVGVAPDTVTAVAMPPTPNPMHPNGSPNPP
ncbi:MAG: hypothetical protein ACLP1X_10795 [Polyangiaceae bacterium]